MLVAAPHVLAQAPGPLRPAGGGSPWSRLLLPAAGLVAFIAIGIVALVLLRRYLKDDNDVGDLTLADIRRMKDEGQITAVEYDAMREMLIKRETARMEAEDATKDLLK